MLPLQYFALDSSATGYADALGALAAATTSGLGYAPDQVLRAAAHDPTIKIVAAIVDEADLTGTLAPLHSSNYPNALCRHRWDSGYRFRLSGFHMLGESVRSFEGVAGRVARHVRPQQGATDGSGGGGGQDYGAGDGTTDYDAFNGPQDPAIADGGLTSSARHRAGHSYFIKGGAHVRWGTFATGGNIDFNNGGGDQGSIAVEDAAGLGAAGEIAIYFEGDSPLGPGMLWGTYMLWQRNQAGSGVGLPWEEYEPGVYVNGYFQGDGSSGTSVGNGQYAWDADVDDITASMTELLRRHLLKGKTSLADLSGAGGRGRYHAQHSLGGGDEDWDAVLFHDGAGAWTDLTAAANDATADDFTLMPAGAADGAYVAFVSSVPFSAIGLNLAQARVGGSVECVYSRGGGSFGAFANLHDPSNGLSSGTAPQVIAFNPRSDWAQDTFAAGESFEATGYAVIFRKTGGTITQAARGDQARRRRRAVYVHRWNDGALVRGLCTGGASGNFENGLRYRTEGKGNIRFVNGRIAVGPAIHDTWANAQVTLETMQVCSFASHQFGSGNDADLTMTAASHGARWWDVGDHLVQSSGDPIFTSPQYGLVAHHGDDPGHYADIGMWSELCFTSEGLYKNGGNPKFTIRGAKFRNGAVEVHGMNDVIRDLFDAGADDNHTFAGRNDQDWSADTIEKFGIENFLSNEFYAAGEGDADAPLAGSGSRQRGIAFRHGYFHTWNGRIDPGQPGRGFASSGDPDRGKYVNGTGRSDGCAIEYVAFKDLTYDSAAGPGGVCITWTMDGPLTVDHVSAIGCNWLWRVSKAREQAAFAFVYDASEGTYTDVTDNVKPSGNVATPMFPAAPAAGDMFIIAMAASMGESGRRANLVFGTPAAMGTAACTWIYRNDAGGWSACENVSNGQLTSGNVMTFDRPSDYGTIDINGTSYHAFALRFDGGAFATPPTLIELRGRVDGAGLVVANFVVVDPIGGVGKFWGGDPATSGSWVQESNGIVYLGAGQDENTPLYRWATNEGGANMTLAAWQALQKSKTDTDALEDSVFGQNVQLVTA